MKISKFVPVKNFFLSDLSNIGKAKKKILRFPLCVAQMANDLYNIQLTNLKCGMAVDSEVVVAKLCIGWNNTMENVQCENREERKHWRT